MNRIFVTLFCISFFVGINGASIEQPTSIDEDAVEIAELTEKLWSLKPAVLNNRKPLVYCQIIDKCCDDEDREEAVSIMSQFMDGTGRTRFVQIMDTCMKSTDSNKANKLCPAVVQSITLSRIPFKHSHVEKYFDVLSRYTRQLMGFYDHIISSCNSEELHALFCLSNRKLVEKCTGKILQKIYDDDSENYQTITMHTKQVLTDLYHQISKAFIKNTNMK